MKPIPPGLVRCGECGGFNGSTEARHLNQEVSPPDAVVSVACVCNASIPCRYCRRNLIRQPGTSRYDERTNTVSYMPTFGYLMPCADCRVVEGQVGRYLVVSVKRGHAGS